MALDGKCGQNSVTGAESIIFQTELFEKKRGGEKISATKRKLPGFLGERARSARIQLR